MQAWEAYKTDHLLQLVDATLETKFAKDEAVQFIKVGLLCVQETASLRPRMSTVVKMLANETEIQDVEISQPGLVADLMEIKMGQHRSSYSSFSRGYTSMSSESQHTSYF